MICMRAFHMHQNMIAHAPMKTDNMSARVHHDKINTSFVMVSGNNKKVIMANNIRIEEDLLGMREVPADAYYGVHTLRAIENFYISN
ncbi:MAG: aspartate ammonia-lyase, partial [Pantoea agglomerans]